MSGNSLIDTNLSVMIPIDYLDHIKQNVPELDFGTSTSQSPTQQSIGIDKNYKDIKYKTY
jgi:hypothetical protein